MATLYEKVQTINTTLTEFKTAMAAAITAQGVPTASTDSLSTMVANVGKISGGGTAIVDSPLQTLELVEATVYTNLADSREDGVPSSELL